MSDRIYCHGELVETFLMDGWFICGGCGHRLSRVGATFALGDGGLPSEHGNEDENQGEEDVRSQAADVVSGGAAEAGHV